MVVLGLNDPKMLLSSVILNSDSRGFFESLITLCIDSIDYRLCIDYIVLGVSFAFPLHALFSLFISLFLSPYSLFPVV